MKFSILGFGNIGKKLILNIIKNNINVKINNIFVRFLKKKDIIFLKKKNLKLKISKNIKDNNIIELTGNHKFLNFFKKKFFISANKRLISKHFYNLSYKNHLFEASVGGGIQIINILKNLNFLNFNKIDMIINGTTNFIITKIFYGSNFDKSINFAKKKGFVEKNINFDISGKDISYKTDIILKILKIKSKIKKFNVEKLNFSFKDYLLFFKKINKIVKYISKVRLFKNLIDVNISLFLVSGILKYVNFEKNIIKIKFKKTGSMIFTGKGAGKNPTCSSVISDILNIKNNNFKKNIFFFKKYYFVNNLIKFNSIIIINLDKNIKKYYILLKKNIILFRVLNNFLYIYTKKINNIRYFFLKRIFKTIFKI
ncbi:hypothetical protein [Candidatus Vidania fulgoroideorum]